MESALSRAFRCAPPIVATILFMASGVATGFVVRHVL